MEGYHCNTCHEKFRSEEALRHHLRTHTGKEAPVRGDLCVHSVTGGALTVHERTPAAERPHVCDVCGKRFTTPGNLKRHLLTHTGEKPYSCGVCGKRFNVSSNLTDHLIIHTGERPHACDVCDKRFIRSYDLEKHLLTHTNGKPFSCDICGKRFTVSSNMTRHRLIHTGEKPHACDVCDKRFTQSDHLKTHLLTHTGEWPHACDVCDERFSQSRHLERHRLIHTSELPYAECSTSFADPSALRNHERILTGEKPHTCKERGKRLTQPSNLETQQKAQPCERARTRDAGSGRPNTFGGLRNESVPLVPGNSLVPGVLQSLEDTPPSQARDFAPKVPNGLRSLTSNLPSNFERASTSQIHTPGNPHAGNTRGEPSNRMNDLGKDKRKPTSWDPLACNVCGKSLTDLNDPWERHRIRTDGYLHACSACEKRCANFR